MVAEVVEAGLAYRAGAGMSRGALDRLEVRVAEALGVVRVASHDRHHLAELVRGGQGARDGLVVHPHRGQPRDPRLERPLHQL